MKLFISHSTKDGATYANDLTKVLERMGHACWIAPRDVKAGVPYPGQIIKAIEGGAGLVVIVTPGANDSQDVLQEVQAAHSAKKTIAPVIVARTALSENLRYYLAIRHQIEWSDLATTAAALLKTFVPSRAPAKPSTPTPPSAAAKASTPTPARRKVGLRWPGEDSKPSPATTKAPTPTPTKTSPPSQPEWSWREILVNPPQTPQSISSPRAPAKAPTPTPSPPKPTTPLPSDITPWDEYFREQHRGAIPWPPKKK